jgi:hypothetical protein
MQVMDSYRHILGVASIVSFIVCWFGWVYCGLNSHYSTPYPHRRHANSHWFPMPAETKKWNRRARLWLAGVALSSGGVMLASEGKWKHRDSITPPPKEEKPLIAVTPRLDHFANAAPILGIGITLLSA